MKKLILSFLICLISTFSYAQKFGILVGVGSANLNLSNDLEEELVSFNLTQSGILAISGSFLSSFEIGNQVYLEPELSYNQKGYMLTYDKTDDLVLKINFIEINPMLRYGVSDKFSIYTGPYFGYGISGTRDVLEIDFLNGSAGNATITSEEIDFEADNISQIDYGLNFGVSYVVNEVLDYRIGYCLGFANLDASEVDGYSVNSNNIYLKIGYLFGNY